MNKKSSMNLGATDPNVEYIENMSYEAGTIKKITFY